MSWTFVLLGAWIALEILKRLAPKWGAKAIAKAVQPLAQQARRYERIEAAAYPDLDLAWYANNTTRLVAHGFVHLEDFIDLDIARSRPSVRVFIRSLRGGDGTTVCGLYHYRDRGWLRFMMPKAFADVRVCDLETELSNGTFLCTSNAPTVGTFDFGKQVVNRRVDSQDIEQLLRAHAQSVAAQIQHDPTIMAVRCQTADDVRALTDRLQLVKSTYRRSLAVPITDAELHKVSGGRYDSEAAAVSREIESAAAKKASK